MCFFCVPCNRELLSSVVVAAEEEEGSQLYRNIVAGRVLTTRQQSVVYLKNTRGSVV